MNAERLGLVIALVFLAGPLFFHALGLHGVASVGWAGVLLCLGAWEAIRRDRRELAAVLWLLAFDINSIGYGFALGRDSLAMIGVLTPLVLVVNVLDHHHRGARFFAAISRIVVLPVAFQVPIEPWIDPAPTELVLAAVRGGAAFMAAVVVATGLLSHVRVVQSREQVLEETATRLEEALDKRRAAEERLRVAVWEADRADRARTAFLGTVSHELRTPMAMILGLTEAMWEEADAGGDDALRGDLEEMIVAERRLHDAIESLLAIAGSQGTGAPDRMNVKRFLDDVREGFARQAEQAGIQLQIKPIPGDVSVDRGRALRVVRELVDNAIRHARTEVEVSVERIAASDASMLVRFEVSDDGPGLTELPEPETVESLSVALSEPEFVPPKGIGLFLARRLVEQLGGTLTLDTDRAAGTSIVFTVKEDADGSETIRMPMPSPEALRKAAPRKRLDSSVMTALSVELGDPAFLADMVSWFETSARERIAEGRRAGATGDGPTLQRAAHSLKGLAGTVGAVELQSVAREIEAVAESEDIGAASAGWSDAESELDEVLKTLSRRWGAEVPA